MASNAERNPIDALAEEFAERYRRGERPSLTEYTRKYPELARRNPGTVSDPCGDGAAQARGRGRLCRPGLFGRQAAGAHWRLSDSAQGWPRWDGHRLRGRAGLPGPSRRLEGRSCHGIQRSRLPGAFPPRSQGRRSACITPTSFPSSVSAKAKARCSTPCSSFMAKGLIAFCTMSA